MSHQPYLPPRKIAFPDIDLGGNEELAKSRTRQKGALEFPDVFDRGAEKTETGLGDDVSGGEDAKESLGENDVAPPTSEKLLEDDGTRVQINQKAPSEIAEIVVAENDVPQNSATGAAGSSSETDCHASLMAQDVNEGATESISAKTGNEANNTAIPSFSPSLSETVKPGVSKRTDYPLFFPHKMALLIIDIQDYLSSPDSTQNLATDDSGKNNYLYKTSLPMAISNIQLLVETVRKHRDDGTTNCKYGSEVIFTYLEALTNDCRDVSLDYKLSGPKLAELPGPSHPALFLPGLQPCTSKGRGDILIPKTSCSVFNSTNLHYVLRNLHIEQLVVCGQLTDQCVESAVRDAADLGYLVTVAEDACAATGTAEHAKGLAGMKGFARIVPTQNILEELRNASMEVSIPPMFPHAPTSDQVENSEAPGNRDGADSATEPIILPQPPIDRSASAAPSMPISIKPVSTWSPSRDINSSGATIALLRALRSAGVQFLRYVTLDAVNSIRCKAAPLDSMISAGAKRSEYGEATEIDNVVSIAEVCIAGLPGYADSMIPGTNLDARNVLTVKPDARSLRVLPYAKKTALVMGTLHNQRTGELSPLCTRGLLTRIMETARDEFGLAFSVGAELEFSLFFGQSPGKEGHPPQAVDESLFGHTTTLNDQEVFISDLHSQLGQQDIDVQLVHAESASGQLEIVLKYQKDAMKLADDVILAKETIRACAKAHGMRALFLPKIGATQAGNGMHLHLSFRDLRSDIPERNDFPHNSLPGALSEKAGSFIEGILHHLPALTSVTMPSMNSFRRVGPGCWTGHNVSWSVEDKEAPLRVCLDLKSGEATNVEFKLSDSTANIYLELALILASGMHGLLLQSKLRPMGVADNVPALPTSFSESLGCLKRDEFLLSVLGKELSTGYIALRQAEIDNCSDMSLEEEVMLAFSKA